MSERRLELRDRVLAPVAIQDDAGEVVGANLGALVRRLILFEEVILDSYAMRELPALIDALGVQGFRALLESRALRIRADGWVYGEGGSTDILKGGSREPLPLFQYALVALVPAQDHRKEHISRYLEDVRKMPFDKKESQEVRLAIVDALTPFPEAPSGLAGPAIDRDVLNPTLLGAAIEQSLSKIGLRLPTSYDIRVEQPHPDIFAVETNIGEQLRLGDVETDKVIEQALLAIAGLNKRLEEMQSYKALAGFRADEYSLLDQKLHFILDQVDPRKQEKRFDRVVELAGLPDPETAEGSVDVKQLLKVRDSEAVESSASGSERWTRPAIRRSSSLRACAEVGPRPLGATDRPRGEGA